MSETLSRIGIACTVNGERRSVHAFPMARLLDVLREELHLTGTKEGCGEGECGACAVLLNGALVNSCLVPAIAAEGADIRTIEGVSSGEQLNAVQEAFLECGGAQLRLQPESEQDTDRVGALLDAGAETGEPARLFVDRHLDSDPKQARGSRQPADPGADDRHLNGSSRHSAPPLGLLRWRLT